MPYIVHCSIIKQIHVGVLLTDVDSDTAVLIAREFFKQRFIPFEIVNTVLQDSTWLVKGLVTAFGLQSNRILAIDSKTGRIISC